MDRAWRAWLRAQRRWQLSMLVVILFILSVLCGMLVAALLQ